MVWVVGAGVVFLGELIAGPITKADRANRAVNTTTPMAGAFQVR